MPKYFVSEVAELLDLSVETVRKKLQKGDLEGEKIQIGRVPTWLVHLDYEELPEEVRASNSAEGNYKARIQALTLERDAWRDQAAKLLENNETLGRVISNMETERGK